MRKTQGSSLPNGSLPLVCGVAEGLFSAIRVLKKDPNFGKGLLMGINALTNSRTEKRMASQRPDMPGYVSVLARAFSASLYWRRLFLSERSHESEKCPKHCSRLLLTCYGSTPNRTLSHRLHPLQPTMSSHSSIFFSSSVSVTR